MTFNRQAAQTAEERFIENPSVENRNSMILHHTALIHKIAKPYRVFVTEEIYKDLVQEGQMGLLRAAKTFDPTMDIKFATYAGHWIRAKIQTLITNERSEEFNVIKKIAFDRGSRKLPGDEERRKNIKRPVRLGTAVTDMDGSCTWEEMIPDPDADTEKDIYVSQLSEIILKEAQPIIIENKIMSMLLYDRLLSRNPKTLEEIGQECGCSREWVRLNEVKLRRGLKQALSKHPWIKEDFVG